MPRGAKPGERRGGRAVGTRNKATLEKERQAALIAERTVMDARRDGKKLAKEMLEDFMLLFASMAAHYQPAPPGQLPSETENPVEFYRNAELAIDCAAKLAPYQSPTFKAIQVVPPPELPPPPPSGVDTRDEVHLFAIYRRMVTTVRGK